MALLVWLVALVAVGQQGEYLSAVEAKKLIGRVNDRRIKEASGLVASRKNKGVLWTHNDSGDRARVFAISTEDGHVLHELSVRGAGARDWEDLALSPSGKLCAGEFVFPPFVAVLVSAAHPCREPYFKRESAQRSAGHY